MQAGLVFCDFDNQNVLCYTQDRKDVELVSVANRGNLNKAICLSDLTEMKNVQERLQNAGFIADVYIVNIATLYKGYF